MRNAIGSFQRFCEHLLTRFGFGMRAKLIIIFVIIKVIPLVLLSLLAWRQAWLLGEELGLRAQELTAKANQALMTMGEIAVKDSVSALNDRATEDIERMSTDAARRVADFLYDRDDDILFAAGLDPSPEAYRSFVEHRRGKLVVPGRGGWLTTASLGFPPKRRHLSESCCRRTAKTTSASTIARPTVSPTRAGRFILR